ncbi:MAG TPA: hypothetical protein GXZ91_09355 [Christensenellaceae bacterium]|nr:hypothetical protein [Christensenellaceae bacterium]
MKKFALTLVALIILSSIPFLGVAEISGDEPLVFETPFMITNAGQGPGGKMGRLLIKQAKALELDKDFFYVDVPYEDDVTEKPYSCIVIVIGSTDKGLGATGITIDEEIDRVNRVMAAAKEAEVPVVAVLLEKDKRSDIPTNANERCIDAVCPGSAMMIVIKDGNQDGRFDKLKEEYDIPLVLIDSAMDFGELSKTMFNKK